jgi:alpha-amylase
MGVMMQVFYWDCPGIEGKDFHWWEYVTSKLASLSKVGFTALWLPPACKGGAGGGKTMGYDPYDYYDLGDIDQKGTIPTWFGTKDTLLTLIKTAHDSQMQVYADLVINQNSGADAQETNPLDGKVRWTLFNPKSGLFPRNWDCFHPSRYETTDGIPFNGMPDLCHRNPRVYTQLLDYARWLIETIGFDGFRYDFVKGYGAWMTRAIQELRGLKGDQAYKPFGVGELWDGGRTIEDWLAENNTWSDNPVTAFDFPLRWKLRDLCDTYGYSLKNLIGGDTIVEAIPMQAVTFVENHDVAQRDPITNDKLLAYAFILTHEGYPCVFWQDYFNYGLALSGEPGGIDTLLQVHEQWAGGTTSVLYVDDNLYIMQRNGLLGQPGLIFVLNNLGSWNGTTVKTQWPNQYFQPMAWWSNTFAGPINSVFSMNDGTAQFWAPPRGYAVYVPK